MFGIDSRCVNKIINIFDNFFLRECLVVSYLWYLFCVIIYFVEGIFFFIRKKVFNWIWEVKEGKLVN